MNVYLDLTLVLEILMCLSSIYFTFNISQKKCKKRFIPLPLMLLSLLVYSYKINLIFIVIIRIVVVSFFFFLEDKTYIFPHVFLYFVSDIFYRIVTSFFIKETVFINGFIMINDPLGTLSYLVIFILVISLYLSTKFVDYTYRLSSYKTSCFIEYLNKKVYASAYFDTGNTLKYLGVPVVFASLSNFPFEIKEYEDIEVSTINGNKTYKAIPCLLSLESKKESIYIYLALMEEKRMFHGCEVLLNAYLY